MSQHANTVMTTIITTTKWGNVPYT